MALLVPRDGLPQLGHAGPGGVLVVPGLQRATARAMTSGGPSTSGKPCPRLTDCVRTASADICVKIVGAMPCNRVDNGAESRVMAPP